MQNQNAPATLASRVRPYARALAVSALPLAVRNLAWQWLGTNPPAYAAHAHAMRASRQPRARL